MDRRTSHSTPLTLALDIGTTSVRAGIYSLDGELLEIHGEQYPTQKPAPGWEEQDPNLVVEKAFLALKKVLEKAKALGVDPIGIQALGISSQMYSLMAQDSQGKPLTHVILWSDSRSSKEASEIKSLGAMDLYHRTGCPASSIYPVAKIRFLNQTNALNVQNQGNSQSQGNRQSHGQNQTGEQIRFIGIKEYFLQHLGVSGIVDHSIASATGLFNIHTLDWDPGALSLAGIQTEQLSRVVSGTDPQTSAKPQVLKDLGLSPDLPIFLAAGDGPCASLGAGAISTHILNIDLGTSGALRAIVPKPLTDDQGVLWCGAVNPGLWVSGGIITNAGNGLDWLGEFTGSKETILASMAQDSCLDAKGLVFLPYLRSVRSPLWNDEITGTILGLRTHHGPKELTAALIQSIGFDLRRVLECLNTGGVTPGALRLSGGISQSRGVGHTLSAILQLPIKPFEQREASLRGAAAFAFKGLGLLDQLVFPQGSKQEAQGWEPDSSEVAQMDQQYQVFRSMVEKFQSS